MRYDFHIEANILYAVKEMDALKEFWYNPHVNIYIKSLILPALPMNLLLWECAAWSLCGIIKNKLELFLQIHSRWILIIYMFQVKNDHIR